MNKKDTIMKDKPCTKCGAKGKNVVIKHKLTAYDNDEDLEFLSGQYTFNCCSVVDGLLDLI